MSTNTERELTVPELAERFRLSTATVYRKVADQEWPHVRFGKKIRFTESQVEQILRLSSQDVKEVRRPRRRAA